MLSLLAAVVIAPPAEVIVVDLLPTDDVWVYPHASDPSTDQFLRVWGVDGKSAPGPTDSIDEFSFGILKWSLKDVPKVDKLTGAKLILSQTANPAYTVDGAKQAPVEARAVASTFTEKTWSHGDASKFAPAPGVKAMFGFGYPDKIEKDKVIVFEIDLMKGQNDFKAHLAESLKSGNLALALTSPMDASNRAVYKLFSKDGPKESRPVLRLTFSDH